MAKIDDQWWCNNCWKHFVPAAGNKQCPNCKSDNTEEVPF